MKRLHKIIDIILYLITFITVIVGAIGLSITLINPVNLWWAIAPVQTPFGIITYSSVMEYLSYFQEYYWYSVGISSFAIAFGYVIHIRSLKDLWEGIKASPRAILYSPITFYKGLKNVRDYIFEKIEYLNGESAKWRRFFNVMKSPYSFLRFLGFSPQMAIGLLVAGGTASTAVTVNELVIERSFSNGSAGIYSAPGEYPDEELWEDGELNHEQVEEKIISLWYKGLIILMREKEERSL